LEGWEVVKVDNYDGHEEAADNEETVEKVGSGSGKVSPVVEGPDSVLDLRRT
jgi:hypothetical protein